MSDMPNELSPEVGGTIIVNSPCGDCELAVEGATSPKQTNVIPGHHQNGDEPVEY